MNKFKNMLFLDFKEKYGYWSLREVLITSEKRSSHFLKHISSYHCEHRKYLWKRKVV